MLFGNFLIGTRIKSLLYLIKTVEWVFIYLSTECNPS